MASAISSIESMPRYRSSSSVTTATRVRAAPNASRAELYFHMEQLPVMDGAFAMYQKGMSTGVNRFNEQLVQQHLRFDASFPDWQKQIIFDPQTSGGLLVALPAEQAGDLVEALKRVPTPAAAVIGEVSNVADGGALVIG